MRKTRPGADRQRMMMMRADVAQAKRQLDRHVLQCAQCSHAGSDVYDHCQQWWALATDLHRQRRKLRRWEVPENDLQEPLPGMPS